MSTLTLLREQIPANRRAYQVTVAIVVAALALLGLLVTLALGFGVSGLGAGLVLAVLVVGFAPGRGSEPLCATPAPRSPTRAAGPATTTWSRASARPPGCPSHGCT